MSSEPRFLDSDDKKKPSVKFVSTCLGVAMAKTDPCQKSKTKRTISTTSPITYGSFPDRSPALFTQLNQHFPLFNRGSIPKDSVTYLTGACPVQYRLRSAAGGFNRGSDLEKI